MENLKIYLHKCEQLPKGWGKERKKWLESEGWRILYLAFFLTTFYLSHTHRRWVTSLSICLTQNLQKIFTWRKSSKSTTRIMYSECQANENKLGGITRESGYLSHLSIAATKHHNRGHLWKKTTGLMVSEGWVQNSTAKAWQQEQLSAHILTHK